MDKIVIEKNEVTNKIREFYDPDVWHHTFTNAVDLGDKLEIQWVFASYKEINKIVMFVVYAGYDESIPSIASIVPSAWVSEAETKDMFGANFEGVAGGLFLESDAPKTPLRKVRS